MSAQRRPSVAVIGAGMTGLVAAHRLADRWRVDVYERWPGLGGQVAALDVGEGALLERYYHHLFPSDTHIAELYDELGMEEAIEWLPSSVSIFAEGRAHPFTTPLDLLRFEPLPIASRLRMGLAVLWLQLRHRRVEGVEQMTAYRWIRRAMGARAWTGVWGPLLRGKFGDRAEEVSMAWLWARFTVRRQIRGGEARREVLGYPRGGWQPLLERLQAEVEARQGRVLIDRPARRVEAVGRRFRLHWAPPDSFRRGHDPRGFETAGYDEYDAVIATVPNRVFLALLDEPLRARLADSYEQRLESISYHAALCMLLELDRPFSPFYWTNVADPSLPFIGLIEQTNLIPPDRYGGRRFLYVANYLPAGDELLELEPDELLARYESGLRAVNPAFSPDWVRGLWVHQEPDAQPIVVVGYPRMMPPLDTGIQGLVLANTTQIYPEDRGTNYSVRLAAEAVGALEAEQSPQAQRSSGLASRAEQGIPGGPATSRRARR